MKVFILLSVVAVALANRECGENEHFESCGTACPLTCDNYDNPPRFCVLRCDIGCHCDEGYVRSSDGRCVRPEECPAKTEEVCGENQRYSGCGTACPLTCQNYDNPPRICPAMCVIGCECKKGFVKTEDGRCVRPEDCPNRSPQVCGENQRYSNCGSACPLTCDNYENPPLICPLMCVIGCECEKGFVKTNDGRCVRPEDCPSRARQVEKTCLDKPDSGMCLAYMPMYYYDAEAGECKKFIYGGCQGNGNRYRTKEECMDHCSGVTAEQASSDICELPAETGMCRGFFPRFYFDKSTGQCEKFVYGGCGGNENNFENKEACEASCASSAPQACHEPKIVGKCKAYFERYFYNTETEECEKFVYGGCGANSNNFNSKEDCESVCKS